MALIIQCASGHKMSVAEEFVGKRVRCPQCQEVLTVQAGDSPAMPVPPPVIDDAGHYLQSPGAPSAPSSPAPRDDDRDYGRDYDDEPPRRSAPRGRDWDDRDRDYDRRRDRDNERDESEYAMNADETSQLQTVSVGLIFVSWRFLLWIFLYLLSSVILTIALMVEVFARMRGREAEPWMIMAGILGLACGLLVLIMLIFTFIGSGMCCRAPQRSGGKGLILGSLICDGLFVFSILLIFLLALLASGPRRGGDMFGFLALAVGIMGLLCFITGQILLSLFLSRMSHFAHDPRNASSAISTMVLWIVFFLGGAAIAFVVGLILGVSRARSETVALVMLGVVWVNALLMILIYSLMTGVAARLRRSIAAEIQGGTRY